MNSIHIIFVSLFSIIVTLYCSCVGPVAGGSSQQGNGVVVGSVVDASGNSAAFVRVQLLPALYDPVRDSASSDYFVDTTDNYGRYSIGGLDSGEYTAVAAEGLTGRKALITGITVRLAETKSIKQAVLQTTGSMNIEIPAKLSMGNGYAYLPGTTLFGRVKNGYVLIDSVPAVKIPSVNYQSDATSEATVIRYNPRVVSGETLSIVNSGWQYAQRLILNTASSGAGVAGTMYHFPVLIRLTDSNFDFTQAQTAGNDLRFTKSDNTFLPYEIERWDPVAGRAEVWVNVDTLFGNDSVQSITMYWGASTPSPSTPSTGSGTSGAGGAAVFDTAAGFQGVWHLGDAAGDTVLDATVNGYCGVSPDTAIPQIAEGIIGSCREFDGTTDYITMPNTADGRLDFPEDGTYSISAWVMADTLTSLQQTIVSKGRYQYFLWIDSTLWEFWEYQDRTGWEASSQQATFKQWVLLTGVRSGAAQYLYVNGERVDSVSLKADFTLRNTGYDLFIGRVHDSGILPPTAATLCTFKGKMDEVRIVSAAQSPDWVRLCYQNQRADDRLVVFK